MMVTTIQHPRLAFDEDLHEYSWEGVVKPGVSKVLSSVGRVNADGEWRGIADTRWCKDETAAQFGKSFHKAASYSWNRVDCEIPEALAQWHDQFLRWKKEYQWLQPYTDTNGVRLVEYPMYHQLLGYCGTPDLVAWGGKMNPAPRQFRDTIVIVDYKTSTAEQEYWQYQTAAYAELFKALFNPNRRIITMSVRFEADTYRVHVRQGSDIRADWNIFISALNIFRG